MTQAELRELYCKRLEREKQTYVAKATGINGAILSQFKRGKIDLYPHLFSRLESYLMNPRFHHRKLFQSKSHKI